MKAQVKTELESKGSIRVVPEVFDPGLARIDIGGTVYVFPNYVQATVRTAVEAALADFFTVTNQEFGKAIRESDIARVIDEVDGVDYVDLTKLTLLVKGSDVSLDRWTGDATFGDIRLLPCVPFYIILYEIIRTFQNIGIQTLQVLSDTIIFRQGKDSFTLFLVGFSRAG